MVSLNGVCVPQKNGGLPTWSVCQGCHRKLPQTGDTGWLKQQKLVLSQHCRLEVRGQGVCRIVPSEASLLAWQVVVVSLCLPHGLPSICSVQFRSVAQSCPTLCEPMNRSTPGLPVYHKLPEFTQTHVHRVGDASTSVSKFPLPTRTHLYQTIPTSF